MEKHINSIFSKLHLSEEPDVNRRVKAVLVHLAADRWLTTPSVRVVARSPDALGVSRGWAGARARQRA